MKGNQSLDRRSFLEAAGGVSAAALLAGCGTSDTGGDGGSGGSGDFEDTSTDTQTETATPRPLTAEETLQEIDIGNEFKNWAMNFPSHGRFWGDVWSPKALAEMHGEKFFREDRYDVLPYSVEEIPVTVMTETPDEEFWSIAKIDQIPRGYDADNVLEELQNQTYEIREEVEDFKILSTPKEREARAVGKDYHAIAFAPEQESLPTNIYEDSIEKLVQGYNSQDNNVPNEVEEMMNVLGIEDTFHMIYYGDNPQNFGFIQDLSGTQPTGGATTVNFQNGIKRGGWLFEDLNPEKVETIANFVNDDPENYYNRVQTEGNYLIAEGEFKPENNFGPDFYSSETPII